jgi:hypothetical protein
MKKLALAFALTFLAAVAIADDSHKHPAKGNAAFDRLKPLVGTWEATVKGEKVRTTYQLAAGGSTLVENLMPESVAMVNMIHPDGDKVMMTHYCAGANQPRYRATSFEGDTIVFSFVDGTNLGDSYMSGVKLTLVDADHLRQEWTNHRNGKDETWAFEFTRVK